MVKTRSPRRAIRRFLKERQQTQKWLADQLGVTPPAINDLLKGRRLPGRALAVELEKVTGVSVADWS